MDTHSTPRLIAPPVIATTHANDRRRERGRRLLARLAKLSSSFPEFRSALTESLDLIKHEINRCPESDRQLILHAIHLGAWTIEDLKAETRLTRAELQTHLDQLLAVNTILRKESQEKNKLGGRPKILWLPAPNHQPSKKTSATGLIVDDADVVRGATLPADSKPSKRRSLIPTDQTARTQPA